MGHSDAKMRKPLALALLDAAESPAALLSFKNQAEKTPVQLASKDARKMLEVPITFNYYLVKRKLLDLSVCVVAVALRGI